MSSSTAARVTDRVARLFVLILISALILAALVPLGVVRAEHDGARHLLISEVVTGGASASDELIELYNPGPDALPLEGLELVYVSASGATVSRRAAWELGAPLVLPGHHVLIANELGAYASIADALYGSGMAATGGSVALRVQGATTAIDAVGWGTAASTWLEGAPAAVAPAGSSIERLPGGAAGSTIDTNNNLADFVIRAVPDPQNSTSAPTPDPDQPVPTPTPSASPVPTTSLTPSPAPSATPGLDVVPVATARALPDGTTVTIEGTALTGSSFTDGGGHVADATGGIAVLLADGSFERGRLLRVTGVLDDRFSQRTIRSTGSDVVAIGEGSQMPPLTRATGSIDESVESVLISLSGVINGSPTELTTGLAFDVDDGSGAARVVVATLSGIGTADWSSGAHVEVVGVVGQRDSSGSGSAGYRVLPRDPGDVVSVGPAGSPSPSPGDSGNPSPSASPGASDDAVGVISIADARLAPKNARVRVRGVVTMPRAVVDPVSAVIQDGTGAIMLRLGDEVGPLTLGSRVEVEGVRSTKSGMETLRVTTPARALGSASEPEARALRTGQAAEADEARLVLVRGALLAAARRASSGTVSFEIDDGSGPLRISFGSSLAVAHEGLASGTWVEVLGVLGQETTGALPTRGYRVWPRGATDLRMLASATDPAASPHEAESGSVSGTTGGGTSVSPTTHALDDIGAADLAGLRIGATLVVAAWPELDVAGLLWDGERLVAIGDRSGSRLTALAGTRRPPLALELGGLRAVGTLPGTAIPVVELGDEVDDLVITTLPPAPPATSLPTAGASPRWVSLVGRLAGTGSSERDLVLPGHRVAIEWRCDEARRWPAGAAALTGVALGEPVRVVVPCGGVTTAPVLTRALAAPAALGTPTSAGGMAEATIATTDSGRLLAAGLLGLGSMVAAFGGFLYRRFGSDDPEADPTPANPIVDAGASPERIGQSPPTVSLVRMPHERGSP